MIYIGMVSPFGSLSMFFSARPNICRLTRVMQTKAVIIATLASPFVTLGRIQLQFL